MYFFSPLERSEANMELFLSSLVIIEHKKPLLRNAERSRRVLFFYNKKLEAEMLRASLLIYLNALVLFLIVFGSSLLDMQGVGREMCVGLASFAFLSR